MNNAGDVHGIRAHSDARLEQLRERAKACEAWFTLDAINRERGRRMVDRSLEESDCPICGRAPRTGHEFEICVV